MPAAPLLISSALPHSLPISSLDSSRSCTSSSDDAKSDAHSTEIPTRTPVLASAIAVKATEMSVMEQQNGGGVNSRLGELEEEEERQRRQEEQADADAAALDEALTRALLAAKASSSLTSSIAPPTAVGSPYQHPELPPQQQLPPLPRASIPPASQELDLSDSLSSSLDSFLVHVSRSMSSLTDDNASLATSAAAKREQRRGSREKRRASGTTSSTTESSRRSSGVLQNRTNGVTVHPISHQNDVITSITQCYPPAAATSSRLPPSSSLPLSPQSRPRTIISSSTKSATPTRRSVSNSSTSSSSSYSAQLAFVARLEAHAEATREWIEKKRKEQELAEADLMKMWKREKRKGENEAEEDTTTSHDNAFPQASIYYRSLLDQDAHNAKMEGFAREQFDFQPKINEYSRSLHRRRRSTSPLPITMPLELQPPQQQQQPPISSSTTASADFTFHPKINERSEKIVAEAKEKEKMRAMEESQQQQQQQQQQQPQQQQQKIMDVTDSGNPFEDFSSDTEAQQQLQYEVEESSPSMPSSPESNPLEPLEHSPYPPPVAIPAAHPDSSFDLDALEEMIRDEEAQLNSDAAHPYSYSHSQSVTTTSRPSTAASSISHTSSQRSSARRRPPPHIASEHSQLMSSLPTLERFDYWQARKQEKQMRERERKEREEVEECRFAPRINPAPNSSGVQKAGNKSRSTSCSRTNTSRVEIVTPRSKTAVPLSRTPSMASFIPPTSSYAPSYSEIYSAEVETLFHQQQQQQRAALSASSSPRVSLPLPPGAAIPIIVSTGKMSFRTKKRSVGGHTQQHSNGRGSMTSRNSQDISPVFLSFPQPQHRQAASRHSRSSSTSSFSSSLLRNAIPLRTTSSTTHTAITPSSNQFSPFDAPCFPPSAPRSPSPPLQIPSTSSRQIGPSTSSSTSFSFRASIADLVSSLPDCDAIFSRRTRNGGGVQEAHMKTQTQQTNLVQVDDLRNSEEEDEATCDLSLEMDDFEV